MVLDLECEIRDRGSIPSECQIPHDVDLWHLYHMPRWPPPRLTTPYREGICLPSIKK